MPTVQIIPAMKMIGGKCGSTRFGHNQYAQFSKIITWTSEQWLEWGGGAVGITVYLAECWSLLSVDQKNTWKSLGDISLISSFAAYTQVNYHLVELGLDPLSNAP